MLGWRILKGGFDYKLPLPQLSEEEEGLISEIEDRFKEETRSRTVLSKEESEEVLEELIKEHADRQGIYVDKDQSEYLSKTASLHIYGFGPLEPLLENKDIEEISVVGINKPVYIFIRSKGWQSVNACFTHEKAISELVNKMASQLGRRITVQSPRLDAILPSGARLHASLPPISEGEITIRKFREEPFSPKELIESRTADPKAIAFLSLLMHSDSSLIIAGNTASGKTTTLNALFSFVPMNERVLITEETPEINIPHQHKIRLVANKDMGVSLKDLVYDSLRMRPDRIIVGEVRNKDECNALFDVLLAGQARGSYATMHGQNVREAVQRIKSFGISEMDMNSIDVLVIQRRMLQYDQKTKRNVEVRRIVEIAEMDQEKLQPKTIYSAFSNNSFDYKKSSALERIASRLGLSRKETEEELRLREAAIKSAKQDYFEFFKAIQQKFYGLKAGSGQ